MSDDDDPQAPEIEDGDEGGEPEPGTPDNAADPKRLKKQARKAELDAREAEDFWRTVFGSAVGRREMWRILQASGYTEARFGAGPNGFPDPYATFFRAGVQSVSAHLVDQWTIRDFDGVRMMRIEHDPRFPKPTPEKAKR